MSGLFLFIFVLSSNFYAIKTVDFSRIQTRIVQEKDDHANHLTTTMVIPSTWLMGLVPGFRLGTTEIKCLVL